MIQLLILEHLRWVSAWEGTQQVPLYLGRKSGSGLG